MILDVGILEENDKLVSLSGILLKRLEKSNEDESTNLVVAWVELVREILVGVIVRLAHWLRTQLILSPTENEPESSWQNRPVQHCDSVRIRNRLLGEMFWFYLPESRIKQ